MNDVLVKKKHVFIVDSLPESVDNFFAKILLIFCANKIRNCIGSGENGIIFSNNNSLFKRISSDSNAINFISPDKSAFKVKNNFNFLILHKFVDDIVEESTKEKYKYRFAHDGVSVLKVIEPRWLDPLFNELIWKLDYFSTVLAQKPSRVTLIGANHQTDALKGLCQSLIDPRASRDSIGNIALCLYKSLATMRRSLFKRANQDHRYWMGFSDKLDLTSWQQGTNLKRIIFVGTIDRTVVRLREIAPGLIKAGFDVYLVATSRVTLAEELTALGVKVAFAGDFFKKIEYRLKSSRGSFNNRYPIVELLRSDRIKKHRYKNLELGVLASEYLSKGLKKHAETAVNCLEISKFILDLVRPDLVVSFEENEFPRAMNIIASRMKIKTSCILSISPAWYPGLLRREQDELWVSGNTLKKLFSPWVYKRKITVVGDSLNDRIKQRKLEFCKATFLRRHGVASSNGVFGVLSTWPDFGSVSPYDIEVLFRTAAMYSKKLEKTMLVKRHPLQPLGQIQSWLKKWDCKGIVLSDCDLVDFSMACEIVFTPATTAIWQVMLAGTPLASFQKPPYDLDSSVYGLGFSSGRGVIQLDEKNPNFNLISDLVSSPSVRSEQIRRGFCHVAEHMGEMDGGSVKRLVNCATSLIRSN